MESRSFVIVTIKEIVIIIMIFEWTDQIGCSRTFPESIDLDLTGKGT